MISVFAVSAYMHLESEAPWALRGWSHTWTGTATAMLLTQIVQFESTFQTSLYFGRQIGFQRGEINPSENARSCKFEKHSRLEWIQVILSQHPSYITTKLKFGSLKWGTCLTNLKGSNIQALNWNQHIYPHKRLQS